MGVTPVIITDTSANIPEPPSPVMILPAITNHKCAPVPLLSISDSAMQSIIFQYIRQNASYAEQTVRCNQGKFGSIKTAHLTVLSTKEGKY